MPQYNNDWISIDLLKLYENAAEKPYKTPGENNLDARFKVLCANVNVDVH